MSALLSVSEIEAISALAHDVAMAAEPDRGGRQVEHYHREVHSDVSEALTEALTKVKADIPSFDDWCGEGDPDAARSY